MGRAVFGLLLGFVIVLGVAFWARTCLPDPHDKGIEWLHREDVVQMKESGSLIPPEARAFDQVPLITLYGDGSMIVRNAATESLSKRQTSDDKIQSLLDWIDNTGFFNFDYRQPTPHASDFATTQIYVNTK